jgi:cytochrome c oxidase subunit 2
MIRRVVLIGGLLLMAGCAGPQSALDPAGDQAASTELLWRLMLWICGFMYLLVLMFLAGAIWKARHRLAGPPLALGQASPREQPLLRALTGWVGLTVAGLMVLTVGSFVIDRQLAKAEDGASLRIKVTANQWWWKVEYDDPIASRRMSITRSSAAATSSRPSSSFGPWRRAGGC